MSIKLGTTDIPGVRVAGGGGGATYTAGEGIDITNNVITNTAPMWHEDEESSEGTGSAIVNADQFDGYTLTTLYEDEAKTNALFPRTKRVAITDENNNPLTEVGFYTAETVAHTGNIPDIFDLVYPVGSIYMSVNNVDPSTLFGGTWEQLQDRFLLGAGSSYTAGDTGGSSSQTVNFNNGQANIGFYTSNLGGLYMIQNANTFTATNVAGVSTNWGGSSQGSCKPTSLSGSQTLNNMPPYLVVYMWKRTA